MGTKTVWLLAICLLGNCESMEVSYDSEVECAHFAGIATAMILVENLDEKTKKAFIERQKLADHVIEDLMKDISYTCTPSKGGA